MNDSEKREQLEWLMREREKLRDRLSIAEEGGCPVTISQYRGELSSLAKRILRLDYAE